MPMPRGVESKKLESMGFTIVDPSTLKIKVYHSGDRGRMMSNGLLEYRGRSDRQVKVCVSNVDDHIRYWVFVLN